MGNYQTKTKKLNWSLFLSCLIGGILGMALSEIVYRNVTNTLHPVISVGLYFLIVMLGIGLFGVTSELITNNMRESRWDGGEKAKAIGFMLLLTLAFGLLAMFFQFIYGLGYKGGVSGTADDYIILIDNSSSTYDTDPDNERFPAVQSIIDGLDDDHRVMIEIFDDAVDAVFPLTDLDDDSRNDIKEFLGREWYLDCGGTDIHAALMDAVDQYEDNGRSAILLLLSDGESYVDYDTIENTFKGKNLPVFSVAFSKVGSEGNQVLEDLAQKTDGAYYSISELDDLADIVRSMIILTSQRNLLEARRGGDINSILPTIERIIFISILGFLVLFVIGLPIDVSSLLKEGWVIHLPASIVAALVMEFCIRVTSAETARIITCALISIILVHYLKVSIVQDLSDEYGGRTPQYTGRNGGALHSTRKKRENIDARETARGEKK